MDFVGKSIFILILFEIPVIPEGESFAERDLREDVIAFLYEIILVSHVHGLAEMVIPAGKYIPVHGPGVESGFAKDHVFLAHEMAEQPFDGGIPISISSGIHPSLGTNDPVIRQSVHFQHRGFSRKKHGLRFDAIGGDERVLLQYLIQRLRQLSVVAGHEGHGKALETSDRMLRLIRRAKQKKPRDCGLVESELPGTHNISLRNQENPHLRLLAGVDFEIRLELRENLSKKIPPR